MKTKRLTTTEPKQFGSFTVTPKFYGETKVYFNFSNKGGQALYNLATGQFEATRAEVGERAKSWIEKVFITE
jgi:hypothetical protein